MELVNRLRLPVSVDRAWELLLDFERIANAMPGASLTGVDGDVLDGSILIKLGPMRITYQGRARVVERDLAGRRLVMEATGRETRGPGTATARVEATLAAVGAGTEISIVSTVDVTGRPAQMGAGMIEEVGQKLTDEFASRLARDLTDPETGNEAEVAPELETLPAEDVLDLGSAAVGPVLKRLVPVIVAMAAVLGVVLIIKALRG